MSGQEGWDQPISERRLWPLLKNAFPVLDYLRFVVDGLNALRSVSKVNLCLQFPRPSSGNNAVIFHVLKPFEHLHPRIDLRAHLHIDDVGSTPDSPIPMSLDLEQTSYIKHLEVSRQDYQGPPPWLIDEWMHFRKWLLGLLQDPRKYWSYFGGEIVQGYVLGNYRVQRHEAPELADEAKLRDHTLEVWRAHVAGDELAFVQAKEKVKQWFMELMSLKTNAMMRGFAGMLEDDGYTSDD